MACFGFEPAVAINPTVSNGHGSRFLSLSRFHHLSNISLAHENKLHQLDGMLKATIVNASAEFKNIHKNQLETLKSLSAQQMINGSATAEIASRSEATLNQMRDRLDSADTSSLHTSTRQRVEELSRGVEKLANMSEAQCETMKTTIGVLQDLCVTETSHNFQGSKVHQLPQTSSDGEDQHHSEEPEEELRASLKRLCSLAAGTERTVFSRDAQDIIDDVEELLNVVSSIMEIRNHAGSGNKRKRNGTNCRDQNDPSDEELQYKSGVKRIKGFLATSQCIAVNSKGMCTAGCQNKREVCPDDRISRSYSYRMKIIFSCFKSSDLPCIELSRVRPVVDAILVLFR